MAKKTSKRSTKKAPKKVSKKTSTSSKKSSRKSPKRSNKTSSKNATRTSSKRSASKKSAKRTASKKSSKKSSKKPKTKSKKASTKRNAATKRKGSSSSHKKTSSRKSARISSSKKSSKGSSPKKSAQKRTSRKKGSRATKRERKLGASGKKREAKRQSGKQSGKRTKEEKAERTVPSEPTPPEPGEEVITVINLSKRFRVPKRKEGFLEAVKSIFDRKFEEKFAVHRVSFSVRKGEILGLLGPNGAGKSTIIKMLTGILEPTEGTVKVLGFEPFKQRSKYVRHIGALFGQKSLLWWDIPAADAFLLSKELYDIPDRTFTQRRDELVERLGIQEVVKKPVRNLSLGERMKCEFVMALLHNPPLVFLDEPTIGLDVFAKETIREFITQWNAEHGTTFILTTHDMDDIEHLAHRVVVIANGVKVFDNTLKRLKKVAGDKKHIRLVMEKPITHTLPERLENVRHVSDYEAHFTLNRSRLQLQDLVSAVTEHNRIMDLEVHDPDTEEIIKEIYRTK